MSKAQLCTELVDSEWMDGYGIMTFLSMQILAIFCLVDSVVHDVHVKSVGLTCLFLHTHQSLWFRPERQNISSARKEGFS